MNKTSPTLVERIERWPIDQLLPFANNSRTHSPTQIAQIAGSISEFGFVNPILMGPDNVIVAGHARALAARQLGLTDVPVIVLAHLTPTQRRALVIADNRLALSAAWDEEMLHLELAALRDADFDLDLLGFNDDEIAALLTDEEATEGLTDEDAAPEPPQTPVTIPGDLWALGSHRVLCGDATASTDVRRLLASDAADLVFTDPPYNVSYEGYTEDRLKIQGDRMNQEQFEKFLADTFRSYRAVVKPRGSRRLADQAQPFAFRIIPDETGAVEKHGGVLGRIIGGPAGKPCVVRIPAPCEMHPCLADIPGKSQRRRSSAGLANAESRIVENECDLAGVERARPSLQYRRPPTEDVLIGGRDTECGLAFALRDVDLAPGGGRNGSPEPERSRLGILPAIGLHNVPPSNSQALADVLL